MDRGVKYSCVATKYACAVIAKETQNKGRDRAKEDCGGFVFISTHFSLERGKFEEVLRGAWTA